MAPPVDDQFFEPILGEQNTNFRKLKTIPVFSVHLLISTIISLTGIILAAAWPAEQRCHAYFVMMYLRAAFWVLTFIFDHLVKWMHEHHRLIGYHDMHRSTKMIRAAPMLIVSLWSVFLMGIQTLMHQYYSDEFTKHCQVNQLMSPTGYVAIFSCVETIVLGAVTASYIAKVKQFNAVMPEPDALRESNDNRPSVGFTQRGAGIVELLEKQADLIDYYKEQLDRNMQALMDTHSQVHRVVATSNPDQMAGSQSQ